MPTVDDVIVRLETLAPPALAASWDNVGLLLGSRASQADRILTCLTLTADVAAEAAASDIQLVVTHHPILFRGAKRLTMDTEEGRAVLRLARAEIAVYSPHTSFDNGTGGINDQIAARLQLQDTRPLRPATAGELCKLVAFVPNADLARVSDAVFAAGAGVIGDYRECGFRVAGVGTFFGGAATHPTIGQKGRREEVQEWRFEAVCPRTRVEAVARALRAAHSYEEPAIDVYALVSPDAALGEGRIGQLPAPISLQDLIGRVKVAMASGPVQFVGAGATMVRQVAIACGAAGEFLADARFAGADVFLTGEMRFHELQAARAAGIAVILPGHYATERFAMVELADWLNAQMPGVSASASTADVDPVAWAC